MKKAFILCVVTVLIAGLISVPLLLSQQKPAAAPAEKKCSECHAAAYDDFIKAHTSADAAGAAKGKMCHSKLYASWETNLHKGVQCEGCHGMTGKAHIASKKPEDIKTCGDCHTHAR